MLHVANIKEKYLKKIPAVCHVNNTSRIQTVTENANGRYYRLIKKFYELTGVPMILNTSLNDSEPIVNTPNQAIELFMRTKMDVLVIEDFVVEKQ